jgi:hypothetical protein
MKMVNKILLIIPSFVIGKFSQHTVRAYSIIHPSLHAGKSAK